MNDYFLIQFPFSEKRSVSSQFSHISQKSEKGATRSGELPPPPGPTIPPQKTPRKKKTPFTPEEDQKIRDLVEEKGTHAWTEVTEHLPGRTTRQCRERWNLYLAPDVCNDPWVPEDEAKLLQMYCVLGPKWTLIARAFPNRTANNVKNKLKQCVRRAQKLAKNGEKRKMDMMATMDPAAHGLHVMNILPPPPVVEQLAPAGETELPTEPTMQQALPDESAQS